MTEKLYQLHECDSLPKNSVQVVFNNGGSDGFYRAWNLIVRKESTWEDLEENHHLEEVGQIIWQTKIEIRHCPYCGCELVTEERASKKFKGEFEHHDFSKW